MNLLRKLYLCFKSNTVVVNTEEFNGLHKHLENLEQIISSQAEVADKAVRALSEANDNNIELATTLNFYEQNCLKLNDELRETKLALDDAKFTNNRWFKTILGFSRDECILVNKSLWGHDIEAVELENIKVGKPKGKSNAKHI